MAFWIGSTGGGTAVPSVLSIREQVYSPAYGEEIDAKFIYQLLPSFYRTLMDDQAIFSNIWEGVMHRLSADSLNLWQTDYSKSLSDVPTHSQRKWLKYDFTKVVDFTIDPSLTTENFGSDQFVYSPSYIKGSWASRIGGPDLAVVPLTSELDHDCSLSWSTNFMSATAIDTNSAALFGYYYSGTSATTLSNALFVGIQGPQSGSSGDNASLIVGQVSSSGAITIRRSGPIIPKAAGKKLRLAGAYSASDTSLRGTVYDREYTKASGTASTAPDTDSDGYTAELTDSSKNFDDLGVIPGDLIYYDGDAYEIATVSGSVLTTTLEQLPSGASSISYTVVGEKLLGSAYINLRSMAGDYKFKVNSFGTSCLDLTAASGLFGTASDYSKAQNKSISGTTDGWSYLDPTVDTDLLSIPRLQTTLTETLAPSDYLYGGTDYDIKGKVVQFAEPPATALYAEYSAYDERRVESNFGVNVGLTGESTEDYLGKVKGLYYSYFTGPTVSSLKRGTHIHIGLPVANHAGTVTAINEDYSGVFGRITIGTKGYLYPLAAGTQLEVGDEVEQFQPLCDGIYYQDYVESPTWFADSGVVFDHEIQKYHAFRISMNLDVFDPTLIGNAAAFIRAVKPTWKNGLLQAYMADFDDIDVEDGIHIRPSMGIVDTFGGFPDPYYDSAYLVDSDIDYDWLYDSATTHHEWEKAGGALHESSYDATRSLFWKGTAEASRWLTGILNVEDIVGTPENRVDSDGAGFRYKEDADGPCRFVRLLGREVASGTCSIDDGTSHAPSHLVTVSGATFNTSGTDDYIPSDGSGVPIRAHVRIMLKKADGSEYASTTVTEVVSDTEIKVLSAGCSPENRAIPSGISGESGLLFEIRSSGPSGKMLFDGMVEASGVFGGGGSDVTSFTTSGSSANFTSLIEVDGSSVPVETTYLAIHATNIASSGFTESKDVYIAKVASVASATELVLEGTPTGYYAGTAPSSFGSGYRWELFRCPNTRLVLGDGTPTRSTGVLTEEDTKISDSTVSTIGSLQTDIQLRYFPAGRLHALNMHSATSDPVESWGDLHTRNCIAMFKTVSHGLGTGAWARSTGIRAGDILEVTSPSSVAGSYPIIGVATLKEGSSVINDWVVVESYTDADKALSPALSPLEQHLKSLSSTYKTDDTARGSGSSALEANIRRPVFGRIRAGDTVVIDDGPLPGEYAVSRGVKSDEVPLSTSVVLSTAIADATGVTYRTYGQPDLFATVMYVHSPEVLSFRDQPSSTVDFYSKTSSGEPTGFITAVMYDSFNYSFSMSLVDNNYGVVYYDRYFELSPDEEVSLVLRNGYSRGVLGPYRASSQSGAIWPNSAADNAYMASRWFSPSESFGRTLRNSFLIPLCGREIISGRNGGSASGALWTASNDSTFSDMFVFEDTGADFTVIARDSDGRPNSPTFILIEENQNTSETLSDWQELHPRYYTLQIYDVISATQVHLRFHDAESIIATSSGGEHPSIPGTTGLTAAMEAQWGGGGSGSAHLVYTVRDAGGVDDRRFVVSDKAGVWHEISSLNNTYSTYTTGADYYDIPGSSSTGSYSGSWEAGHSGLPLHTTATLTRDIPLSTGTSEINGVPYLSSRINSEIDLRSNAPAFPHEVFPDGFTLTNGSTAVSTGSIGSLNTLIGTGKLNNNDWVQGVPTRFDTNHDDAEGYANWTTSPGEALSRSPVFMMSVDVEPEQAEGTFNVNANPTGSFTVTIAGTAVSVTAATSSALTAVAIKNAVNSASVSGVRAEASGTVTTLAAGFGASGNSITISSSDSGVVASGTNLTGGVDAAISTKVNYTGESCTTKLIVRGRSISGSIGSFGSFTDWINHGSGDTITHTITEKTVDEGCG